MVGAVFSVLGEELGVELGEVESESFTHDSDAVDGADVDLGEVVEEVAGVGGEHGLFLGLVMCTILRGILYLWGSLLGNARGLG